MVRPAMRTGEGPSRVTVTVATRGFGVIATACSSKCWPTASCARSALIAARKPMPAKVLPGSMPRSSPVLPLIDARRYRLAGLEIDLVRADQAVDVLFAPFPGLLPELPGQAPPR